MRRAALLAAAALVAGCGDGDGAEPAEASAAERAVQAIRDCRVRSMVTLHSGVLVLELKGGETMEVPGQEHRRITREIERASPRCGDVVIATE